MVTKSRKAVNAATMQRRRDKSASIADAESRVFFTDKERKMPSDKLKKLIRQRGGRDDRDAVYVVRRYGYFRRPGWPSGGRRIVLTERECDLEPTFLATRLGVSFPTAVDAKERGFYVLNGQNMDTARAENRPALTDDEYRAYTLPEVLVDLGGKPLGEWRPEHLVAIGLLKNVHTAGRVVARGYCRPRQIASRGGMSRRLEVSQILAAWALPEHHGLGEIDLTAMRIMHRIEMRPAWKVAQHFRTTVAVVSQALRL